MARLPVAGTPEAEPLSPWAEDWFGEPDVRDATATGLRGDALADHLAGLAWRRYSGALRGQERIASASPPRGTIVSVRPAAGAPTEAGRRIVAVRRYLFTRSCEFADRAAFLAVVEAW